MPRLPCYDWSLDAIDHLCHDDAKLRNWLTQISPTPPIGSDARKFASILATLPPIVTSHRRLNQAVIEIGHPSDTDATTREQLTAALKALHPWRKGPWQWFGVMVDAEWRSDQKWDRLAPHIDFHGKSVLDVGSNNNYTSWRAVGAGARAVVAVEPTLVYLAQACTAAHYLTNTAYTPPLLTLPMTLEAACGETALPECFDCVLSMGVFYHRRSPFDHLTQLHGLLREAGELIFETLVIDGCPQSVLVPPGRYAQMNNVWFIPSVLAMEAWLRRAGFTAITLLSITTTTPDEQRRTDWMRYHSLSDGLLSSNPSRTIENLPAPQRALWRAKKG